MRSLSLLITLCFISILLTGCGLNDSSNTVRLNTSVTPAEGGTITPNGGEFKEAEEIEIIAEPAEGFIFEMWDGDVTGTANPVSVTLDADKNVNAIFTKKQYPLTIETEGEGMVNETVVKAAKSADYEHGTEVRLRAQPDWGWQFVEWKGAVTGSENPVTLVVNEAKTVTAVFAKNQYSINITIEGEGRVERDPDKETYEFEEEINLTAVPENGWRLAAWKGDIEGDLPDYTIKAISEDMNVTAEFIRVQDPLWAMGYNHNGQLGDGTRDDQAEPVRNIYDVKFVSAGAYHSLFIKNDGTLWGVGFNNYGQLGNGNEQDQHRPVLIDEGVIKVSGGEHHSLYIKEDGTLWAMGENTDGQLGDGTNTSRLSPVLIDENIIDAAAGAWHSVYVKEDGTLWTMGRNTHGQLGDGTTENKNTPVLVDTGVEKAGAGKRHSLYIKSNGTLYGMGRNAEGQLGIGPVTLESLQEPSPVQIATNVQLVTGGTDHTLYIRNDGTLWAMGNNEEGQLGDGTNTNRHSPVQIDTNARDIAAGNRHSLYVKSNGQLYTMGFNATGQLGDGSLESRSTPVLIDDQITDVAAGINHSLYIEDSAL